MSEMRALEGPELEHLLREAMVGRASASLRVEGSVRMLGQLHIEELEPGRAIGLRGAKFRDFIPPVDTPVTLSLIMGEVAVAIHTRMIEPVESPRNPPLLRTAWPTQPLEFHTRDEVRVANPVLPALDAVLFHQGRSLGARLLNLTETGMGLGLDCQTSFAAFEEVEVETCLPGGSLFRARGQVRHFEILDDDPMPTRLGLVLTNLPPEVRQTLRSLIQARRMYFSQDLREG